MLWPLDMDIHVLKPDSLPATCVCGATGGYLMARHDNLRDLLADEGGSVRRGN